MTTRFETAGYRRRRPIRDQPGLDHRLDHRARPTSDSAPPASHPRRPVGEPGVTFVDPPGRMPAVLVTAHPTHLTVRCDGLQGQLRLQRVLRTVRIVQGAVTEMTGSDPDATASTTASGRCASSAVEHDTDDSVVVTFDRDDAKLRFEHGQHLTLRREFDGVELRRSYSICSRAPDGPLACRDPSGPGWCLLDLGVDRAATPATRSTHCRRSDTSPTGSTRTSSRRYAALAAGSGITPILSIVSTILAAEPTRGSHSSTSTARVDRRCCSIELQDVRDRHLGRLSIAFAFTREEIGGELLSRPTRPGADRTLDRVGHPARRRRPRVPVRTDRDDQRHRDALIGAGLSAEQIHREIFTTKQQGTATLAPQEITETSVAIATGRATLHGRTSSFDLYEGDSVLDAVQRVRPDAPFSCRSGVCSTCQAVIRDGSGRDGGQLRADRRRGRTRLRTDVSVEAHDGRSSTSTSTPESLARMRSLDEEAAVEPRRSRGRVSRPGARRSPRDDARQRRRIRRTRTPRAPEPELRPIPRAATTRAAAGRPARCGGRSRSGGCGA